MRAAPGNYKINLSF